MNNLEIEKKWRKKWEETGLYKFEKKKIKEKK